MYFDVLIEFSSDGIFHFNRERLNYVITMLFNTFISKFVRVLWMTFYIKTRLTGEILSRFKQKPIELFVNDP